MWRRHRAWWREVLDDDEADEDAAAARTKRDEAATVLLKIWHLVQPDRGLLFGAFGLLVRARRGPRCPAPVWGAASGRTSSHPPPQK